MTSRPAGSAGPRVPVSDHPPPSLYADSCPPSRLGYSGISRIFGEWLWSSGARQTWAQIPDLSLTSWVNLDKSLNFSKPQFPPLKNGYSSCHLRRFLGRVNGITDVQCPVVPCLIHRKYSCSSGFFPTAHPAGPSPASEGLGLRALRPKLHALSLRALGFLRRSPGRKVETDSLSSWGSLTLGACNFATILC